MNMELKSIIDELEFLYKTYGKDEIKVSCINVLNESIKVFYYLKDDDRIYEFTRKLK